MISKLNTQKNDYINPEGVTYFSLGFQPEGIKKHNVGFGGIFAFFAKIVTKPNKLDVNKKQNYKPMKRTVILLYVIFFLQITARSQKDTVFVYGPGGPFPAMNEAALVFGKKNHVPVQVVKGPVSKWEKSAIENADIIYSGSEYMMTNFGKKFGIIKKETITPLYLRKSGLLVRPGNPKHIHSFSDIFKPGVKVLVVTGAGLTGVWESMAGKTKSIDSLKMLRKNIVFYAANSGIAKKKWINDKSIDVWITWNIWQISNSGLADFIPVKEKFTIYRDCGIALTANAERKKAATEFFNFLKSKDAKPIFKKWGWITD